MEPSLALPGFTDVRILARGPASTVYQAREVRSQLPVAIKEVHLNSPVLARGVDVYAFEADLLRTVNHPFIIKFFDVVRVDQSVFVVMEYASNGNLLEFLRAAKRGPSEIVQVFAQLVSALHYLHHTVNYLHRDLKLENVLLDDYGNVRLIDFGLSKQLMPPDSATTTLCGSLPYCAPEVFRHLPYGKPVDVWSLGICLYAMATGTLPFEDAAPPARIECICTHDLAVPLGTPSMIADLLAKMLNKNPDQRITIEQVSQHPWIKSSPWEFYFQKGFRSWALASEDDQGTLLALKKIGIDPQADGPDAALAARVVARLRMAQRVANPELFLSGGGRGMAIPVGTPLRFMKMPPTRDAGNGADSRSGTSLLEGMQTRLGLRVGNRTSGRISLRPHRPVSTLYSATALTRTTGNVLTSLSCDLPPLAIPRNRFS
jgi:serine/threonine protein kinase